MTDITILRGTIIKIAEEMAQYNDITWRIGGSSCLFIQGVNVIPSDIELITTEGGAYRIFEIFDKFQENPVEEVNKGNWHCHLGTLEMNGFQVEIQGNLHYQSEGNLIIELLEPIHIINVEAVRVPICPLEEMRDRYMKYDAPGADVKVRKINEFLGICQ
jgi:hypothetical protein